MNKMMVVLFLLLGLGLASCEEAPEISLTDDIIELEVGETKQISAEVMKEFELEFFLPNETVAKLEGTSITGVSAGEVMLTVKVKNKDIEKTITVKVTQQVVEVSSINVTGDNVGFVGEEITLTAEVLPTNETNKDLVWTSSDELIETVTNGVVSLLKAGEVTIKATIGSIEQTHVITVSDPIVLAESITISGLNQGLVGQNIQLTA